MLKENWRLISRIERLSDNLIIIACFFLAYNSRRAVIFWNHYLNLQLPFEGELLAPMQDYSIVLIAALVIYNFVLTIAGAYSSMRFSTPWQLFRKSVLASVVAFFGIAALLFISKIDLSRSFLGIFCVTTTLAISLVRFIVLRLLRYWRRQGRNYRNVLICGVGEQAVKLAHQILGRPELGLRIVGFADLAADDLKSLDYERNLKQELSRELDWKVSRFYLGKAAIEGVISDKAIDEVMFTDVLNILPQVEEMIVVCSEQGIRSTIVADLFSSGLMRSEVSYFGDLPLIHFQTPPGDRWELYIKRLIDVLVSGSLLILLSPLFILISLIVLFSSGAPVLFKQRRVGLNGRVFTMLKFRSMKLGAQKELESLKEHNEMQGPVFKIAKDPRITPVGRFLRRFSLDELPQLWNVLIGDMSLVGPRPPVPSEVHQYERKFRRRLSMRPGITCSWQVSGRSEIKNFQDWVKLDLDYIDNWSLWNDFKLLFRTIPAVLTGSGAR